MTIVVPVAPPWNEADRLAALARYGILDTPREPEFDDIARLAADVCETPIAVVNLIESGRQWFKAEVGIGVDEMPLEVSVCTHAILRPGVTVFPDLTDDPRFAGNPLVQRHGGLRFYAGAVLETPDGLPLGTLCVLDTVPRPGGLDPRQQLTLEVLARQVMAQLELRRAVAERDRILAERAAVEGQLRSHASLLECMTEGVSLSDEAGTIVYTNPAEDAMFGYARGELVGQNVQVQNAYPPEENARVVGEVIAQLHAHGSWGGEFLNQRKDGTTFLSASRITRVEINGRPHWLCVQRDVTEAKAGAERERFFAGLAERLRTAPDPVATAAAAAEHLGVHLRVARTGYAEIDEAAEVVSVKRDWTDGRAMSLAGEARLLDAFGPALIAELVAGRTLVVDDYRLDPLVGDAYRATWESIGTMALIVVPLVRHGRVPALLYVHEPAPRRWTAAEVALVEAVAERTWAAVEQARAEERLRDTSRRLDAVLSNATVAIFLLDGEGRCTYMNAAAEELTGYRFAELVGRPLHETVHHTRPDGRPFPAEECPILLASPSGATARGEEHLVHRSGRFYPVAFTASPMRDETGALVGTIVEVRDITEEKRAQARQKLLLDELDHRAKNLLAIVQGIATQTFRGVDGAKRAGEAFHGRLSALAAAHNLLTHQAWESGPLRDVVGGAIAPYDTGAGRFVVRGPDLHLAPKTAVSLALALHELATNAAKYGALSLPSGTVEVAWTVADGTLELVWVERGGPPVRLPAARGFGSRMLERALAAELGGTVRLAFEPGGVVCRVSAPLPPQPV